MSEIVPTPLSVPHGNVFGTGSWFTFHCPCCKRKVCRSESKTGCEYCGQKLDWEKADG